MPSSFMNPSVSKSIWIGFIIYITLSSILHSMCCKSTNVGHACDVFFLLFYFCCFCLCSSFQERESPFADMHHSETIGSIFAPSQCLLHTCTLATPVILTFHKDTETGAFPESRVNITHGQQLFPWGWDWKNKLFFLRRNLASESSHVTWFWRFWFCIALENSQIWKKVKNVSLFSCCSSGWSTARDCWPNFLPEMGNWKRKQRQVKWGKFAVNEPSP